jgi:hypothetical protein
MSPTDVGVAFPLSCHTRYNFIAHINTKKVPARERYTRSLTYGLLAFVIHCEPTNSKRYGTVDRPCCDIQVNLGSDIMNSERDRKIARELDIVFNLALR